MHSIPIDIRESARRKRTRAKQLKIAARLLAKIGFRQLTSEEFHHPEANLKFRINWSKPPETMADVVSSIYQAGKAAGANSVAATIKDALGLDHL